MYGRLEHLAPAPRVARHRCRPSPLATPWCERSAKNLPEVIVNKRPVRPLILLNAVAPRLAARVGRARPIREFAERMAEARERL